MSYPITLGSLVQSLASHLASHENETIASRSVKFTARSLIHTTAAFTRIFEGALSYTSAEIASTLEACPFLSRDFLTIVPATYMDALATFADEGYAYSSCAFNEIFSSVSINSSDIQPNGVEGKTWSEKAALFYQNHKYVLIPCAMIATCAFTYGAMFTTPEPEKIFNPDCLYSFEDIETRVSYNSPDTILHCMITWLNPPVGVDVSLSKREVALPCNWIKKVRCSFKSGIFEQTTVNPYPNSGL